MNIECERKKCERKKLIEAIMMIASWLMVLATMICTLVYATTKPEDYLMHIVIMIGFMIYWTIIAVTLGLKRYIHNQNIDQCTYITTLIHVMIEEIKESDHENS